METFHIPALLQEAISFLDIKQGKKYIDATIGGGGHAFEILKKGGEVLGIDVDKDAIDYVREKFSINEGLTLVRGNFKDIGEIARSHGFEKVAGILFDLGISSYQLETPGRGFSIQKEGPLDMRMDQSLTIRALDLVNALSKGELYELYRRLGEEHYARAVAAAIVRARKIKQITTTKELATIVQSAVPRKFSNIHPATRVFQALRIAVNDELNVLDKGISEAVELLERNGKLVVISFHSLEDRIVKEKFNNFVKEGKGNFLTDKLVTPGTEEIARNRRSRSAKMRVFMKI